MQRIACLPMGLRPCVSSGMVLQETVSNSGGDRDGSHTVGMDAGRTRIACNVDRRFPVCPTPVSSRCEEVGASHGGNAGSVTYRKLLRDGCQLWTNVAQYIAMQRRFGERIRQSGGGGRQAPAFPARITTSCFGLCFGLCFGPTIIFRQPSCPLDFCSGGMEYHRRRGF